MLSDVSSSNINSLDCIIDRKSLENRAAMANTVATIKNESGSLSSGVQTQDSLLLEEDLWDTKLLKENIGSLCTVIVRIKWWVCEQDRMLFWRDFELIENMAPKCFHIIPVRNNTVLNRVVKLEDSTIFVL